MRQDQIIQYMVIQYKTRPDNNIQDKTRPNNTKQYHIRRDKATYGKTTHYTTF